MRLFRAALWLSLLVAAALLAGVAPPRAVAGELVSFPSDAHGSGPTKLLGYMTHPAGEGPFPAVVVLHGCGGLGSTTINWADRLSVWGYVALAVDTYGSRGIHIRCRDTGRSAFIDQPLDAGNAHDFLARQKFVDAQRIAVLGTSMGGTAVLNLASPDDLFARLHPGQFRAAIALYPSCNGFSGIMTMPTLVLIGDRDDWTPAQRCREMKNGTDVIGETRGLGDRSMVDLVVYRGAYHSFDTALLPQGVLYHGHWLQFNQAATERALVDVRAFLKAKLAGN